MAEVDLSLFDVDNGSAKGTVLPAPRGGGAAHYSRTVTTSAAFQIDGDDWVAQSRGFVRIVSDAKLYVRFAPVGNNTPAAAGAGWAVLPDLPEVFSVERGDRIVWAAA